MAPEKPLPYSDEFQSVDEYVDSLLLFATSSILFQTLCGGVHILDFFTTDQSLYNSILPSDWRLWLMDCGSMDFLDLLMRDNLDKLSRESLPPRSLISFIKDIRRHSLCREPTQNYLRHSKIPRHVTSGMIPKKVHEVTNFANYCTSLADGIAIQSGREITHFVDFGSGQNYLGRALASSPYDKHIIAVESKKLNINGAKDLDVLAKVAEREKVMRNKKLYRQKMDIMTPKDQMNEKALRRSAKLQKSPAEDSADMRPSRDLATIYAPAEGKGSIQYIEHIVNDGDLSDVIPQINGKSSIAQVQDKQEPHLLAISIHSCGNLSHHGIRSLLLNPSVEAVAIVGCCYNLLTERLGPPTYKIPTLRPNLQAINSRVSRASAACDPHGYPMSNRVATVNGEGVRLNITARMMAVQAPQNWTEKESDTFFTRHFFRALLQKIFLDFGVVAPVDSSLGAPGTEPIIIGSLRKTCYSSFRDYVHGAVAKLSSDSERGIPLSDRVLKITDEEIEMYEMKYRPRKRELSVMWSLMAFSASVVESLIVVDRWLYLKQHPEVVKDCWVEAVFNYEQSPRNLVVVGIKK